jgi:hypothetical protein
LALAALQHSIAVQQEPTLFFLRLPQPVVVAVGVEQSLLRKRVVLAVAVVAEVALIELVLLVPPTKVALVETVSPYLSAMLAVVVAQIRLGQIQVIQGAETEVGDFRLR